jgi:hypothetical protein
MDTFDVLIVYGVFGVLFGFRRCDFRSSDLFPFQHYFFQLKVAMFQQNKIKPFFAYVKI